jgi:sulfide:quinone oxidoreductase
MSYKLLTPDLYISAQLTVDDLKHAAKQGIKTIINNRPDQEESDQPLSIDLEKAAHSLGLNYYHIPVSPGKFNKKDAKKFAEILKNNPAPFLAFCRTGNRSCNLWALSQVDIHDNKKLHQWANNIGMKLCSI